MVLEGKESVGFAAREEWSKSVVAVKTVLDKVLRVRRKAKKGKAAGPSELRNVVQ